MERAKLMKSRWALTLVNAGDGMYGRVEWQWEPFNRTNALAAARGEFGPGGPGGDPHYMRQHGHVGPGGVRTPGGFLPRGIRPAGVRQGQMLGQKDPGSGVIRYGIGPSIGQQQQQISQQFGQNGPGIGGRQTLGHPFGQNGQGGGTRAQSNGAFRQPGPSRTVGNAASPQSARGEDQLWGSHSEQNDSPRNFHQDNNATPPESRPVNDHTTNLRGGAGHGRSNRSGDGGGNRRDRKKPDEKKDWNSKDNPLKDWGKENWAKPRKEGRDPNNVPAATVYDDEPVKAPSKSKSHSTAPALTPTLREAHPGGDIRFPPPDTPSPDPRKLITDDGRRIFYSLFYQNSSNKFDDMRDGVADAAKEAREAIPKDQSPQMKAIQAKTSKQLELVSQGPRGSIWRVDDTALDVVGCLLDLDVIKLPGDLRERFELFGIGLKEYHDDILLISWHMPKSALKKDRE
jgi:hypothetical protein